jgi:hypothetical protein
MLPPGTFCGGVPIVFVPPPETVVTPGFAALAGWPLLSSPMNGTLLSKTFGLEAEH